ncbi:hypothetical protein [Kitasatospora sp. DSM 101779]|uniref:hypothetical protein n=1 Tax=Kitasatospora sp. DSM 101779 TaxID=2853165 RepID=UPI0021DA431E|nr:hypothetical protein [Kitasatospora sp. DSM 101779]MCU7821272.1 hypothetical protein [Kitasatospora sp. DSM 101779]
MSGYVYVGGGDTGPMAGAEVGRRVAMDSGGPPWLVVVHTLDRVHVTRWPGRLFRVAAVAPADADVRESLRRANEGFAPSAGHSRAHAVDVLAELSPGVLFGPAGEEVARVADAAAALTPAAVGRLAPACTDAGRAAYAAAWDRWLVDQPNPGPYLGSDHAATLLIPGAGRVGSPIGHGFLAVHAAVRASALTRGGAAAFTADRRDEDGEDEDTEERGTRLAPAWSAAADALLGAAMVLGAPDLLEPAEAALLTAPWRLLTGGAR